MNITEAITAIGQAGIGKVSYVEITTAINVNNNRVSKVAYSARAWRPDGPDSYPTAASYELEDLVKRMGISIAIYSSPAEDRSRKVKELEAELAELKGNAS